MSNANILLVAHDTAPSRCLAMLIEPLLQSVGVVGPVLNAQEYPLGDAVLQQRVQFSDFVLIGMSSSEEYAEIELKAAQFAREAKVPYGFYSDTKFAINRAAPGFWFHELAQDASLVVGVMHKGAAILFPKAYKVQTGNPLDEEMSFPTSFERGVVRDKLDVRCADMLVHVAGGKFPAANCTMLMLVAEAVAQIHDGRQWEVVFTPHPGDPALTYPLNRVGVPQLYAEIAKYSPVRLQVILKERIASNEVLVGSDVLVELTGSVSRMAAYQRIPVVSLHSESTDAWFKAEGGMLPYELVAAGAAVPAKYDVQVLANDLRMLVVPGEPIRERILANQRKNYIPSTERGVAVRAICDALVGQIK